MSCNYKANITRFCKQIKTALQTLEEAKPGPFPVRELLRQLRKDIDAGKLSKADFECVRALFIPIRPLKYEDFKVPLDRHFEFKRGDRMINIKKAR